MNANIWNERAWLRHTRRGHLKKDLGAQRCVELQLPKVQTCCLKSSKWRMACKW